MRSDLIAIVVLSLAASALTMLAASVGQNEANVVVFVIACNLTAVIAAVRVLRALPPQEAE